MRCRSWEVLSRSNNGRQARSIAVGIATTAYACKTRPEWASFMHLVPGSDRGGRPRPSPVRRSKAARSLNFCMISLLRVRRLQPLATPRVPFSFARCDGLGSPIRNCSGPQKRAGRGTASSGIRKDGVACRCVPMRVEEPVANCNADCGLMRVSTNSRRGINAMMGTPVRARLKHAGGERELLKEPPSSLGGQPVCRLRSRHRRLPGYRQLDTVFLFR